jgi:phage-related protein
MVDIGNKVLPIFEKIAQKLEQWMQALDKLSPKQQQMIVEALLIAAAVGPILLILGSLFQVVGTIITIFSTLIGMIPAIIAIFTSPVTWIILLVAAIALAAYEIYKHWTEIKQGAEDLWHSVAGFFSNLGHDISSAVSNWFSGIKSGLDNFRNQFVQWGKDLVSDIVKIFTDIPNEIKSGISHGISSAGNLLSSLEGSLKGGFDSAFGIPHNAMGGSSFSGGLTHLNEFGPETAILPKGTQIVPADQAKQGGGDVHVHIYGDMMGVSDDTMRTLGDQVAQQLGLRTRQLLNGSF